MQNWRPFITASALFCFSAFGGSVRVTFEAQIPRHFTNTDVFLSGDHPALTQWQPRGIPMKAKGNGIYTAEAMVDAATPIEFKTNIGDWDHAETDLAGKEIPNRKFECSCDCKISFQVANYRVKPFHVVPGTAAAGVTYYHEFYADDFKNFRSAAIYLPPQYSKEPKRRFPVIYALDGQNLFDVKTMPTGQMEWNADETLDRLIAGGFPPVIMVGIYSTARRADEYLPCAAKGLGGMAKEFARFLVNKVKPFIDQRYRTLSDRGNTSLMGASFGGSFALYAAQEFGQVFSRFFAWSPGFFWANRCTLRLLENGFSVKPDRIWLSMGDKEGETNPSFKDGVWETHEAHRILLKHGLQDTKNVKLFIDPGGYHNEKAWGNRLETALRYIYQ